MSADSTKAILCLIKYLRKTQTSDNPARYGYLLDKAERCVAIDPGEPDVDIKGPENIQVTEGIHPAKLRRRNKDHRG